MRTLEEHQECAQPQGEERASLAPKLDKGSARVGWAALSAAEVCRLQRGVGHQVRFCSTLCRYDSHLTKRTNSQYPLWATLSDAQLQLRLAPVPVPLPPQLANAPPGSLILEPSTKQLVLRCADAGEGAELQEVKKEGGKWVRAREWWNGLSKIRKGGAVALE